MRLGESSRSVESAGSSLILIATVLLMIGGCSGGDSPDDPLSRAEQQRQYAPSSAKKYLLHANRAYQNSNYRRALALVDSAEKRASNFADVHFMRGRILTDLRQFEEANKAYTRVRNLAPDYEGLRFNMANNAFRQGDLKRAVRLYRRSLEREHEKQARANINLGRSYAQLSKPDSAEIAYRHVLQMENSTPADRARAHSWLSQLYENDGRLEPALEHARKALELDEDELKYRYKVGSLLFQLNRYDAAVEHLRAVAERRPAHYSAHYNLGQALARLGEPERAQAYLNRADSLEELDSKIAEAQRAAYQNPSNVMAWLDYGDQLRKARRLQSAIKAYQIALNLSPGNLPLMDNIANLYMAVGDTSEALRRYRHILRQDSTMARTWLNLGVAYAQSGRIDSAKNAMKRAIRHRPNYRRAEQYLARLNQISP